MCVLKWCHSTYTPLLYQSLSTEHSPGRRVVTGDYLLTYSQCTNNCWLLGSMYLSPETSVNIVCLEPIVCFYWSLHAPRFKTQIRCYVWNISSWNWLFFNGAENLKPFDEISSIEKTRTILMLIFCNLCDWTCYLKSMNLLTDYHWVEFKIIIWWFRWSLKLILIVYYCEMLYLLIFYMYSSLLCNWFCNFCKSLL